jgi:hypothetical protein
MIMVVRCMQRTHNMIFHIPVNDDNTMDMIGHDNKFIQSNIWKMLRYLTPQFICNTTYI